MALALAKKRTAFLDTNALIGLSLYRDICVATGLAMGAAADFSAYTSLLENSAPPLVLSNFEQRARQSLSSAFRLFGQMCEGAANDDWDFVTSRMCVAEMHHTLLDHRGHERLAQQGIPYRLRSGRPLRLFRSALQAADYTAVDAQIRGMFDDLANAHGVTIKIAEADGEDFQRTVDVAQLVWSRLMMDVLDTIIYAAAVVSMADVLVTSDGAFHDAVARLYRPDTPEWQALQDDLNEQLNGVGHTWPEPRPIATGLHP